MNTFLLIASLLALLLPTALGTDVNGFTFKKIFFVLLENQPITVAMDDPRMVALTSKGTLLANLNAIVNPSQPNYVALIAGDVMGVHNDDRFDLQGKCLIDLLEEKGVSWKTYQEEYPGNCFSGDKGNYRRKHNPFISFDQVRNNATLCSKIVHSDELYKDIQDDTLPQYTFYTPDMRNNGHDTSMRFAGNWLSNFLLPLLEEPNFTRDNLIVVTFDEGVIGHNTIYTLLINDDIPKGYIDHTPYSLFSLLKLVQDQFGLASLNRSDATAPSIRTQNFYEGKYVNMERVRLVVGLLVGGVCAILVAVVALVIHKKRKNMKNNKKELIIHDATEMEPQQRSEEQIVSVCA